MSEKPLKPTGSWGCQISSIMEHSKDCECPKCKWNWIRQAEKNKPRYVVGFSTHPPYPSRVEQVEMIGAFVIECPICFCKFWFHIPKVTYDLFELYTS